MRWCFKKVEVQLEYNREIYNSFALLLSKDQQEFKPALVYYRTNKGLKPEIIAPIHIEDADVILNTSLVDNSSKEFEQMLKENIPI